MAATSQPASAGQATPPADIDAYIAGYPDDIGQILAEVRRVIHLSVPGGEEKIRYGMPAVMLGGRYAIHFAAWKKHLGLYPIPVFDDVLEQELAPFRTAKDSVNFPYAKPIPYDLIQRTAAAIVAVRA